MYIVKNDMMSLHIVLIFDLIGDLLLMSFKMIQYLQVWSFILSQVFSMV